MSRPYLNPKQAAFMASPKKVKVFIGGRGAGKSAVLGAHSQQAMQTMPRARAALMADTEDTIRNRSLPSIIEYWERLGFQEGDHYVIGRKPLDWYETPKNRVTKFQNVISWENGFSLQMISLFKEGAGRGGNFQAIMVDEAALIDQRTFLRNIVPAIRGMYHEVAKIALPHWAEVPYGKVEQDGTDWVWYLPFRQNPLYESIAMVTSMPWTSDGMWLLNYEQDPDALYIEGTAADNVAVVGPDYMPRMRATMPELLYLVEVENHRISMIPDGFYADFSDTHHTTREDPYNPDRGLYISLDFNAGFNSMIVAQEIDGTIYVIDELFVKGNKVVDDLLYEFCRKYHDHRTKHVEIHGDRNGNNRAANSKRTIYEGIEEVLSDHGWDFYRPAKGLDAPHAEKHSLINSAFKEDPKSGLPPVRILRRCKSLIISISMAPITNDFKKDKRSEKRNQAQETATHLSDCLDNLLVPLLQPRWRRGSLFASDIYLG